jgi:hypothetical protein
MARSRQGNRAVTGLPLVGDDGHEWGAVVCHSDSRHPGIPQTANAKVAVCHPHRQKSHHGSTGNVGMVRQLGIPTSYKCQPSGCPQCLLPGGDATKSLLLGSKTAHQQAGKSRQR